MLGLLLAVLAGAEARAFSLIGDAAPWHIQRLGYNEVFGPVNINEEYRWTVPVIYYGMTPAFLSYFGSAGAAEVDKAFNVFNKLPAASETDLNTFPLRVTRVNDRARALGLLDLKSTLMNRLLYELGVGDPSLYVFTLRRRWIDTVPITNYTVIRRNFDPVTKTVSSHINGELWTYISITDGPAVSQTVCSPVDPLAANFPVSAFSLQLGGYYTGLSRDDMGALRHIYSKTNYNLTPTINSAFLASGASGPIIGGGGVSGSPWLQVGGATGGSANSSPWDPVVVNTNAANTNATGGGVVNTNFVNTALRGGVNKLSFVRSDFDSILGGFTPVTVVWNDTVVTNGTLQSQNLARILFAPDFVIHGADLEPAAEAFPPGYATPTTAISFDFFNAGPLNTTAFPNDPALGENDGPGIVNSSPRVITFNTAGLTFWNDFPSFLSEDGRLASGFTWGSFDGSTNAPVVYPTGTLIDDIERQVLGAR